jgi:hypothetical protein
VRNFLDKICRDIQITHFVFNKSPKFYLYEIMCKKGSGAKQATEYNTRDSETMRYACWITDVTDTHSDYVIPIAFPRQQWLRERTLMIPYTCIAFVFQ